MIVLASASPRRKELLSFITTDFKIVPADIEESVTLTVYTAGSLDENGLE